MNGQTEALREARGKLQAWLAAGHVALAAIEDCIRRSSAADAKAPTESAGAELDSVERFMAACTVEDDAYVLRGGPLYELFVAWCRENGASPMTLSGFGRRTGALGYKKSRRRFVEYLRRRLSREGSRIVRESGVRDVEEHVEVLADYRATRFLEG